jgi:23S rRNA pseudouridine1911/1915/1917 synthase
LDSRFSVNDNIDMKFTVEQNDAKKRFDVYLAEALGVTRSAAQHLVRRAEASVNGKPAGNGYRMKAGDAVETLPADAGELPAEEGLLAVLGETKDYVVVDKPAGLTVHATSERKRGTLANMLLARYPLMREVGEPHRPGIVHRLDRDVSGVMVAAKTTEAYEYLKSQFAAHKVKKEYAAVVLGAVSQPSGTIRAPLGRNRKGRMAVKEGGLDAVTHFEVLRRGKKSTLLKITTETGRMHQIRVHLKFMGHPIVGDELYAPANARVKSPRLLLHALRIAFTEPMGDEVVYESPLPDGFEAIT